MGICSRKANEIVYANNISEIPINSEAIINNKKEEKKR